MSCVPEVDYSKPESDVEVTRTPRFLEIGARATEFSALGRRCSVLLRETGHFGEICCGFELFIKNKSNITLWILKKYFI